MRTLVAGWFSFENGHATAGDLLARDLACEWLASAGHTYDVALAPPFVGGVGLHAVDPSGYSHVVFVCGPFQQGQLEAHLLRRFAHCRLIGLNLTMLVPSDQWTPFDVLIERDSTTGANPDMVFLSRRPHVPLAGICLVEPYDDALTDIANAAIGRLTRSREMACVTIDTRLDTNAAGLRTPAEVESLLARMDVVITTRLHGTVLALKNGVPVIAIDPAAGGAKIRRQAELIGWPIVFDADTLADDRLAEALDYCLTDAARRDARACAQRAMTKVELVRDRFIQTLVEPRELERRFKARQEAPPDSRWMSQFLEPSSQPLAPPAAARITIGSRVADYLRRRLGNLHAGRM
jgi:hypothetical protein